MFKTAFILLLGALIAAFLILPLKGDSGPRGAVGLRGEQGIRGFEGLQGEQGQQGSQGKRGYVGPQGKAGLQGFRGLSGADGSIGLTGMQGFPGDPGIHGIIMASAVDTESPKAAVVICPGDSYLLSGGTRVIAGEILDPPWIMYDSEESGPTAWWLGYAGTWVDISDPPMDVAWQVQTYGLCLNNSFVD